MRQNEEIGLFKICSQKLGSKALNMQGRISYNWINRCWYRVGIVFGSFVIALSIFQNQKPSYLNLQYQVCLIRSRRTISINDGFLNFICIVLKLQYKRFNYFLFNFRRLECLIYKSIDSGCQQPPNSTGPDEVQLPRWVYRITDGCLDV